jgi:AbrB family looped-hinge helix DNA binding protein
MTSRLTIDKAGRIVLPKPVRDHLRLGPGDELRLDAEGDRITLSPVRPKVTLRKELGVWVYQGEPSHASISDLLERERENRHQEIIQNENE